MNRIDFFRGQYSWLSNIFEAPMTAHVEEYGDVVFPTAEHLYQAAKAKHLHELVAIAHCPSPGNAKRLGGKIALRDDWESIKVDVMRNVISLKFKHPDLRRALVKTGDAELIEGNTWNDTFWGVCNGRGKNMLGKILMEERQKHI